ncbi:FadR/GntR family transcriptional regulator, partial [Candidatus Protofrankia californiensis]|uniref:FadR/GntR family transcriptional regulator n=1 Tax=Candidatus Protofrankia californiensis TaxID=1839754 RepID=UPI00104133C1
LDAANEAIADENSTLAAFLQANVDWHVGVAIASHNELLTGLMTALSRAIYTATENERFIDAEVRRLTAKAHLSITEAIRAQNPEAAVRRMNRHVHSYAQAVLEVEERTEISVPDEA